MSDSPLRKVRRPEGLREALPGLRRLVPHVRPHLRRQRTLIAGGGAAIGTAAGRRVAFGVRRAADPFGYVDPLPLTGSGPSRRGTPVRPASSRMTAKPRSRTDR